MVYPPGLPTADGLVSAVKYGFQIYAEARTANEKFKAAKRVLESIDLTLLVIESLRNDMLFESGVTCQIEVARDTWRALEKYLAQFEAALGPAKDSRAASKCLKTVQWAHDQLDHKVELLQSRVDTCLLTVTPTLQASTIVKLQQLVEGSSILEHKLDSLFGTVSKIAARQHDPAGDEGSTPSDTTMATTISQCWKKRGGCACRCHSSQRISFQHHQHCFVDVFGLASVLRMCDVGSCTRRDGLQLRVAASGYGIPMAFVFGIELRSFWFPRISLTADTHVVKFTSPGFKALWELTEMPLIPLQAYRNNDWAYTQELLHSAASQKVADIKYLFTSEQVTFRDVDPSGYSWLEKVLWAPWPVLLREAQWDLVEYLISNSPKDVLANPRLLHLCARWIGEGPHLHMLDTLLSLDINPEFLDTSLFHSTEWPNFSDPSWLCEEITPDPMFVDYLRKCLQIMPGFAGCDALAECLLTGTDADFERALKKETNNKGICRNRLNALGQTTTHLAVCFPARLEKLLRAGIDPNAVDRGGSTPLMYAACYGQADSMASLLQHGADPCLIDKRNKRMFTDYAIRRGHLHVIDRLVSMLRSEGNNEKAMAVLDRCLRYYFASGCHLRDLYYDKLKHLFTLGADPDILNGTSSMLHLSCSDLEARLILEAGFTNVNSRDDEGVTPLMKVASGFDLRSTKELLKRGANIDSKDNLGWNALHHLLKASASSCGHTSVQDQDDYTFARGVRSIASIHYLIKSAEDVACRDFCRCACSPQGCSAVTIALHGTVKRIGSVFGPANIASALIDLFCVLQNREPSSLCHLLSDVIRYRTFMESDLKHSCCFGRNDPLADLPDEPSVYDNEHTAFNAAFEGSDYQPKDIRGETIIELGKFFNYLEKQSLEHYNDAVRRESQNHRAPRERFDIDEEKDTFTITYEMSTLPTVSKLNVTDQKLWLANAGRIERSGGLHQRGALQSYLEDCLQIWNEVSAAMEASRASSIVQEV